MLRILCGSLVTPILLIFSLTTSAVSAGPIISYDPEAGGIRLIQKTDVDGKVASRLVVEAKGRSAVTKLFSTITGALFQATARPDDSLKSLPIDLSYKLKGDHEAILCATIGNNEVTSDAPAWIWAVAARFANHEATAAVTLTDTPRTRDERRFERRWRGRNGSDQRLLWAAYHPAVDDTLMGFMLLVADATIGDPEHMRAVTNGLQDFGQHTGFMPTSDRLKSLRAARTLDAIISSEARPGDCAMLTDLDERFVFTISRGKLQISGTPNYHFTRKVRGSRFQGIDTLTENCRMNRHLLKGVNSIVYESIDEFAQHVAFFNYIKATSPERLDAFVKGLDSVFDFIPATATPIALPLPAR